MKLFKLYIDDSRIFGLDLIRMFAIVFVVISHTATILPENIYGFLELFILDGVCIFFVLSGFLIGRILINIIEKKGFKWGELLNFWIRRWFRTLPNYFLFVLILGVLSKIYIKGFPLQAIKPFLYFGQNIYKTNDSFFGESWSLSVEEWFYLSMPLLVFIFINVFKIKFKKSLLIVSIFFIIFSTCLRFYIYHTAQFSEMGDYRRVVVMRMDNLMYGVIGAYISFYYLHFWLKYKNISFFLGLLLIAIWKLLSYKYPSIETFYYVNIFYPLFCFGVFLTLPFLSNYNIKKQNTLTKAITYISLISYSLYLIHYSLVKKLFIDNIFADFFNHSLSPFLFKNVFYWVISILTSILVYKYFEVPMTELRNKLQIKKHFVSKKNKIH